MHKILIDTDVILDFFFDRKPFSDDATKLFMLCEKKVISGFVTPLIMSNLYYLLRRVAKHEKVIDNLKMLLSIMDVAEVKKENIFEALNSKFKDFEDAIQNFSAQSHPEIQVIVTRNSKDFKESSLSVMTPATYLKMVEIY